MKILVIRFRQMGDAILATSLLNTLRQSFPDAKIHFVLNKKIAPLFEGHPSIDKIITFTEEERHSFLTYLKKVWNIVHSEQYDAIIDMRSTMNTMVFALFSSSTKFRIGLRKSYTKLAFNYPLIEHKEENMVERNMHLAKPLEILAPIQYTTSFTLYITDKEKKKYGEYLKSCSLDLTKPIMLANVTAKLVNKIWAEDKMIEVLNVFMKNHPNVQIIFNYAPGKEEENARRIYDKLGSPDQVFINIKAKSSRELVALSSYITLFFGNEGGARHIAHAAGAPSIVICAPGNSKYLWIIQNDVPTEGISVEDILTESQRQVMTREAQYDTITANYVIEHLESFYNKILKI